MEVLKRRAEIGLIAAFLAFLWVPTADTFLHLDRTEAPKENRRLAAFPAFHPTLSDTREFFTGIEAHFDDHFGYRPLLIQFAQRWKRKLFNDGVALRDAKLRTHTQSVVMLGKNGWLFLSTEQTLDDILGLRPFTDAELAAWQTLLTTRRDWLARRGIRYLFVIPPDKHSVYPEFLPNWLTEAPRSRRRIGQFLAYMRSHSDVPILDLRTAILAAKPRGILYRQTDTHWNALGALEAACATVGASAGLGIKVTPPDPAAFDIARVELPPGDLAGMLGGGSHLQDSGDVVLSLKRDIPAAKIRTATELLPKNWKPDTEPLLSENPALTAKAVVFHDSFMLHCTRFLGYSFGRVVYVRQQNWDKRIFDTEKPDIVIDEMLERFVTDSDPDDIRKKDDQPEVQQTGMW